MALRKILSFPDPRLREVAKPVIENTPELQQLIDDLYETMYDAKGVGLAATQIGVALRVAVIDVSHAGNEPYCLINPEIIEKNEMMNMQEGCLSVPGFREILQRANHIKARAFDRDIKQYEIDARGVLAEAVQHEIDHLSGKLYIDYLSPLKRKRIRAKLTKRR